MLSSVRDKNERHGKAERRVTMKIFTEREYRERLFEEIEKAEKMRRLERDLLDVQGELYEIKRRIAKLEGKESE
jgi:predicted  nucleic acid-binding Zn-ribbon protein